MSDDVLVSLSEKFFDISYIVDSKKHFDNDHQPYLVDIETYKGKFKIFSMQPYCNSYENTFDYGLINIIKVQN